MKQKKYSVATELLWLNSLLKVVNLKVKFSVSHMLKRVKERKEETNTSYVQGLWSYADIWKKSFRNWEGKFEVFQKCFRYSSAAFVKYLQLHKSLRTRANLLHFWLWHQLWSWARKQQCWDRCTVFRHVLSQAYAEQAYSPSHPWLWKIKM